MNSHRYVSFSFCAGRVASRVTGFAACVAIAILAASPAQAADGDFVWARAMGGTSADVDEGIAVDSAGNVYTTGEFEGTVDFDPGAGTSNLTSAGSYDIFVSKLSGPPPDVTPPTATISLLTASPGIAVDSANNVYTTGYFEGTVDFDPGAGTHNLISAGMIDIFVSKLDSTGNFVWAGRMGGTSYDWDLGIAVDSAGNVYTTGYFEGTADFDPGAGTYNLTSAGSGDIFVSKLDSSGNFVWAGRMGGTSADWGWGIAVDSAGNVYTTGSFQGTADFDPGAGTYNLTSAGSGDIFVSKLDSSGNFVWAGRMGGTSADWGWGIAVDSAGNVYTTGYFYDTADFDPGAGTHNLTSAGLEDIFVSKLDSTGNFVWAGRMGGTSYDFGCRIAVDSAGNAYTTGLFSGTVDFDPGAGTYNLTSAGSLDIFVSKLERKSIAPNAVTITSATAGPTNVASVGFTVTFDEPVQNFNDVSDVVVTHTGTANTGVTITGGPVTYTATVTGIAGDGSFTLAVSTGSDVQDLATNALASSVTSASVAIDNTAPTVALSSAAGDPVGGEITVSVAFSETSTDFASGDITPVNATVSAFTGSGTSYSFTLTPSATGLFSVSVAAGVFTDATGNGNTASNTLSCTYAQGSSSGCGGKKSLQMLSKKRLQMLREQVMRSDVYETKLPTMRAALGVPLAVRLRADEAIDPATVEGCDEWRPIDASDGWAVCLPGEDWVESDEITVTASALTVSGALVGPVSATFVLGADVGNVDETPDLTGVLGDVLMVEPDRLYDAPEVIWIPLPDGVAANQVELYYYLRTGETPGWHPSSSVAGWLATDNIEEAIIDGVPCIGIEVNHGGTVQFVLRTSDTAGALPTPGGLGDILLCLAMGATLFVMQRLNRRGG